MTQLVQVIVFGTLVGGVYSLMATGLTLTFGVMRIVNMAQGAFLIVSAYLCFTLWQRTGVDPILAAGIIALPMGAVGWFLYRVILERVQRLDHNLTIVATFSLAIITEAIIAILWGPNPRAATPSYFNQSFRVGSVVVPRAQLYAFLLAVAVTIVLVLILRGTRLGHAIAASSENPEGARLIGIDPKTVGASIFAIATMTTAFGGAALSFLYQFTPDSQDVWIGLTLSVVITGGMGSIGGALAAGIALGLAESMTSTYISVRWAAAVPAMTIILVLLIRPQGLFAFAGRQDAAA